MSNMVVRTNVFALNAHRNMKNVGLEQRTASNRLSSGYRINSAADDAAGLAISETMRAQIRGLDQASRNAQDGQAMILTTEGGLEEIGNMLQRTRELLVQASNDTNTQDQRTMIEQEINQLSQEIGSMQQRVEFNTNRVLAMGPALSSSIANATADIEQDAIRVSDAFELVDSNRRAVVEAREMLATLPGTTTFDQLNSRQQAQIERALAEVQLDTVTGGVVTTVNTDIPANIAAVSWVDLSRADGSSATRVLAGAAWDALEQLRLDHVAATNAVADAVPGTPGSAQAQAAAAALLDAATAAILEAGFANVEAVITARDNLGGVTSVGTRDVTSLIGIYDRDLLALNTAIANTATAQANADAARVALDADPTNTNLSDALIEAVRLLTQAQVAEATAQVDYDNAVTGIQNWYNIGEGSDLTITGSTVTALVGALNDRDTALADRTATLNQVRADMLAAAEVQFGEIRDFANFNDTPSSGDFVAFFQVGANQNQGITFDFETVSRAVSAAAAVVNLASVLVANPGTGGGIGRGIEVSPMIEQIQASLDDVNNIRANLGAVQNRMDYTMRSLDISSENLSDSESRVRNADVAREMMRFTMSNVLQQAAVSMLSQANQMPNNLLQLLR